MSRLAEIIAHKRQEIAPWLNHTEDWEERARGHRHFRNFRLALETAPFGFIAEVKRASPSAGIIAEDFDPLAVATRGATADQIGGIRSLYRFYLVAGLALIAAAVVHNLALNLALFVVASGSLGMANGAVFQLLPQRFRREVGIMTGLVGAGGGIGGFYLASSLGFSKGITGSYQYGFLIFASLCLLAIVGLSVVKTRWRSSWGALAGARI